LKFDVIKKDGRSACDVHCCALSPCGRGPRRR
jgi:hypothetical protein